jgi:death-on-curing protein
MRLFYGYNGYTISASEDDKFDLVITVATGELDAAAKIAYRLAGMARQA